MHPILLEIGPVKLHSYGFFLVLGFFLSTWLACLEAKRRGINPNILLDMAMPLLLVSVVCCRILYFLVYPHQWRGIGEFFRIWNGGLSFHGAFVGALGVLIYFSWKHKIRLGALCDLVAPGVLAGYAIGRIGCFMNGCCYGHACNYSFCVAFPDESNRAIFTAPSHPAQLYSTLMGLALFTILWRLRTKPNFNRFHGQLTLVLLAFYAVERFIMEIFRKGATAPMAPGGLTAAQLVSIVAFLVVAMAYTVFLRRFPNQTPQVSSPNVSAS